MGLTVQTVRSVGPKCLCWRVRSAPSLWSFWHDLKLILLTLLSCVSFNEVKKIIKLFHRLLYPELKFGTSDFQIQKV